MKKFLEISKTPLIIGTLVAILFCVDSVLTHYLWTLYDGIDKGFVWVAFVAWTISFGMKNEDRIRMWLGHPIGFLSAVGMIYFGQLFDVTVIGISIAAVLGVFIINSAVMYFDHAKKIWLNSITGIFMGLFLTFSGLGVGLGVDTWANAGMTLGLIMLYSAFGCFCAWLSVYLMGKWNKKKIDAPTEKVEVAAKQTDKPATKSKKPSKTAQQ